MREFKEKGRTIVRNHFLPNNVVHDDMAKAIETALAEAYEKGLEDAAKKAEVADHCDLEGHHCTKEIAENIRSLKPSRKGAE